MEQPANRNWGLGALLLVAASLPTLLTLLVLMLLQAGADGQLRRDLEERATLVASALAESSEYGLISGNAAALDRSVRELLAHDPAIAAIDILDAARRPFVSLPGPIAQDGLPSVELPVRSSVPDIDFFDRGGPHVSLSQDVQPSFQVGPVAGYVRVTMSTEAMRSAQRQRLALQLGVVVVAGLVGLLAMGLLARRVRVSLRALLEALRAMQLGRYDVACGPVVGDELKRVQGALLELADSLGAATSPPRDGAPGRAGAPRDEAPHERIGQRLMGRLDAALVPLRLAAMHAARLADAAAPQSDPDAAAQTAAQTASRILALADQAQAAGAALIEPLRSQIVDTLGLDASLAELVQACAQAQPRCAFSLHAEPGFACADASQASALHRAVHGALALVLARADASEASVRLQALPPSRDVRAVVADNGVASMASNGAAARLARLRDELTARGARMDVQHAAAGGTTLIVTLSATDAP